jgi:SAM-dependent methyltransferase
MTKPGDILWAHRRELPAFRALIRAIEHRLLMAQGELARPLLDIGCGDGHFAQVTFRTADVGLDVSVPSLQAAKKRHVYTHLDAASAWNIPYRDGVFATVLANCAVEHMPKLDQVFSEVARVLKPPGRFVFSVPTDRLNQNLLIAQWLDRVSAHSAANRYREWFRRMQVHYHMYSPDEWQRRIESHGFKVIYRRGYLSPQATHQLELGHYYGAPDVIAHTLFGQWVVWPWRPRFAIEEAVLTPRVAEDDVPDSSCCFFVAEKLG